MTLEDLGNIGELVGAVGVVASLIYLAVQIRQSSRQIQENTNSVLGSIEREDAQVASDFLQSLAENSQLARVWRLGLSEPEKPTGDEGTQFVMLMGAAFYRLEAPFRQYRRGLLSEDSWEPYQGLISRYLRSPAVSTWWARADVPFARPFVEHVDSLAPPAARRGAAPSKEILAPVWPESDRSPAE